MWKQKLNERTLELEDGPPSFFQDLCGSLPCASSAAWWTSDTPCVSTKSKQRRSFSWFSAEAMVKGYQAYRDSWATALSKEMPCPREVGNRVNFSLMRRLGREAWPSMACSIAASCLREPPKFLLKRIQHFHKILHLQKFPAIRYIPLMFWLSLVFW